MATRSSSSPPVDPRVYYAAERTLLAWVRTGLALMGFGFVVARFGLFLRELAAAEHVAPWHQSRLSQGLGTSLVLLGVAANLFAAGRHWQTIRRLDAGEPIRFRLVSFGFLVAATLAVLGLLVVLYLLQGV